MRKIGPNKRGKPVPIEHAPTDWGYVLGVMCSDGCLQQCDVRTNGHVTPAILVRLNVKDEELAHRFSDAIGVIVGRRPNVWNSTVSRIGRLDATLYHVKYQDRLLGERLLELGRFNTIDWCVPDLVLSGNRLLQVGFINGLFDGDGSVRDRTNARTAEPPKLEIGSASEHGLQGLAQLLAGFDIPCHIYRNKPGNGADFWRLIITRKTAVNDYWQQIGITLTRKAERFQNARNAYLNRAQFQWKRIAL